MRESSSIISVEEGHGCAKWLVIVQEDCDRASSYVL